MENKSNSKNQRLTIDDIISEITSKLEDGDYIYRGERKQHCKISSALYREYSKYINIDTEDFDLRVAQRGMLNSVRKHMGEPPDRFFEDSEDDESVIGRHLLELAIEEANRRSIREIEEAAGLEILTELQHYGGETNLIDFTTDYLIAIFFACSGEPKADGRVIVLQQTENIKNMIIRPRNPRHRIVAQKSIFLYPPDGFIEVPEENKVKIPLYLKDDFLTYLEKHHGISVETIYNDIHGFIRYQKIHQGAFIQFHIAIALHHKGYDAETQEERQREFEKAIRHYDEAIKLRPDFDFAYCNRGECWLHLEEWDKARENFTISESMGLDTTRGFRNDYKSGVKEFEERTGLTVPPDLAEMLGG